MFRSLLVVAGAIAIAAAFAPQANAACPGGPDCVVLQHFNFNTEINNQQPPYTSVEGGATLFNDPAQSFPIGGLVVNSTAGTIVNALPGELAGGALDARGNTSGTGTNYCFDIGPINTQVGFLQSVSLSFAIRSLGNGQFTTLALNYSTNGVTWTNFANINNLSTFSTYTAQNFTLPAGANNQATLFIQFCFTGSTNNNVNNHTFIDNIQISAVIPEPTTVTGGVLGVLGLCWQQRRRLIRSVRFRRL
jgi:hypothetical protein